MCVHEGWVPTHMAAAGEPDIKAKLLKGYQAGRMTYKVHLDGYNWIPYFKGEVQQGPRQEFLCWTDDGELCGLRYNKWKPVFMEQRAHGLEVWREPMTLLRIPLIFNIRTDPFERASYEAADYDHWFVERVYLLVPAQAYIGQWLQTFREYPPRQKPASFNLSQVMEQLLAMGKSN